MKRKGKLSKQNRRINRVELSQKLRATSVSHINQFVTRTVEAHRRSVAPLARHLQIVTAPIRKLVERDPKAVASLNALRKIALEKQRTRIRAFKHRSAPSITTRNFIFPSTPGFSLIVPPYDVSWQTGSYGWADKTTGQFMAFSMEGYSSSAVGVFVSSPVRSLVRIAPEAPFDYEGGCAIAFVGPAHTSGGVGIVAFALNDPRPALNESRFLWDITSF